MGKAAATTMGRVGMAVLAAQGCLVAGTRVEKEVRPQRGVPLEPSWKRESREEMGVARGTRMMRQVPQEAMVRTVAPRGWPQGWWG